MLHIVPGRFLSLKFVLLVNMSDLILSRLSQAMDV